MKTITLSAPVKRGETEITKVTLRTPSAGDLRGMMLTMVFQMEFKTMATLIPRLCDLTPDELTRLPLSDFTKLCVETLGFFGDADSLTA